MGQLRSSGFVGTDTLEFQKLPRHLLMKGEIGCLGGIVITVDKTLRLLTDTGSSTTTWNDDVFVETITYQYNAHVQGHRCFLRHDNCHSHPGHPDGHHVHHEDWQTGHALAGSPEWVGAANWPTLGEFIDRVREWYYDHFSELPDPRTHGQPGKRSGNRADPP